MYTTIILLLMCTTIFLLLTFSPLLFFIGFLFSYSPSSKVTTGVKKFLNGSKKWFLCMGFLPSYKDLDIFEGRKELDCIIPHSCPREWRWSHNYSAFGRLINHLDHNLGPGCWLEFSIKGVRIEDFLYTHLEKGEHIDSYYFIHPVFLRGIPVDEVRYVRELGLIHYDWRNQVLARTDPYQLVEDILYLSFFDTVLLFLFTIIPVVLAVAFFTLGERKAMASVQRRRGPNIVGFWGLLQPFADGLKLILKEVIIPNKSNKNLFLISPFLSLFISLISWIFIPFDPGNPICMTNYGLIIIMVISPMSIFGVLLTGLGSNSKYAMLATIRTAAQMVAYEIPISFCYLIVMAVTSSANIEEIVFFQKSHGSLIMFLLPVGAIYFILTLAETNRTPFDLPEAEAELVAGYNVEYSAFPFAAFFLGEYVNILTMSALFTTFFLSGEELMFFVSSNPNLNQIWTIICFSFKVNFVAFWFVFVRASVPRYRFDQLMSLCWKVFIPILFGLFIFYSGLMFSTNCLVVRVPSCLYQMTSFS